MKFSILGYSDEILYNLARNHLNQLSAVNHPEGRDRYGTLLARSSNCAFAKRGELSLNFQSSVVQGLVAGDIHAIETLVAEKWARMHGRTNIPVPASMSASSWNGRFAFSSTI